MIVKLESVRRLPLTLFESIVKWTALLLVRIETIQEAVVDEVEPFNLCRHRCNHVHRHLVHFVRVRVRYILRPYFEGRVDVVQFLDILVFVQLQMEVFIKVKL